MPLARPRVRAPIAWSALTVALAAAALSAIGRPGLPARGAPAAQPAPTPSSCLVHGDATVVPGVVALGESVRVDVPVASLCPASLWLLNLVMVLDGTASMAGTRLLEMRAGALRLLDRLDLLRGGAVRVGVVSFDDGATTHCELTDDRRVASDCIGGVEARGGSSLSSGILDGLRAILAYRSDIEGGGGRMPEGSEVIVAFADGPDGGGCDAVRRAAATVADAGVTLILIGYGPGHDRDCHRSVVVRPALALEADEATGGATRAFVAVQDVLPPFSSGFIEVRVRDLELTAAMPPNMAYVAGSAAPLPGAIDPAAGTLRWRIADPPPSALTVSFAVRPLEAGRHPVAAVSAAFTDTLGRAGRASWAVPEVEVLAPATPSPAASATDTPAGPAPSATRSPSPATQGTATTVPPSATPTLEPYRGAAFLPLLSSGRRR